MARRSRRQPKVRLRGFGVLRYAADEMRTVPEGATAPAFAMRGVYWRTAVLAALSVADMLAQAWWANASLSIGYDPWWLGVIGITAGRFDALGLLAGILAVAPAVGMALFLPAFIWPRAQALFHIMALCLWEGGSRMLGAGLGRTVLYMRGVRDGVTDYFAGSGVPGPLKASDTMAGSWPAVIAGIVFALIALAFAFVPREPGKPVGKPMVGGGITVSVGLLGIVLVELGWMPVSLVLVVTAMVVAWTVLPGEVGLARQCAVHRVEARWMWYSAELIWVEALFVFVAVMAALTGI